MKLCPFVSHMLGEENSTILTIDPSRVIKKPGGEANKHTDDVVILGYDAEHGESSKTQTATAVADKKDIDSHLFCLKDPCRFYQKDKDECILDSMHSLLKNPPIEKSNKKSPAKSDPKILKELDKLWKFQTKSVSELISLVGETEKEKKVSIGKLGEELQAGLDRISKDVGKSSNKDADKSWQEIKKQIEDLQTSLALKEDSTESFSTMLSELVLNLEESLKDIRGKTEEISKRFNEMSSHWEDHFKNASERQEELIGFLNSEKKRRQEEWARESKKEAKTYNNLGVTCFHNGAFAQAKEQFLKAVELDSDFAEAYNNLGLACTELGEEENATDAFKKATELNPHIAAAYGNLGYLLNKQGKYNETIELYSESLGRHTKSSFAYTNLGNAYYKLGKLDKASKAWKKALEIDPSNEKASLYLKRLQSEGR